MVGVVLTFVYSTRFYRTFRKMKHAAKVKHASTSKSIYFLISGSYLSLYRVLFLNFALEVNENTCRNLLESDLGCFLAGNKSTFSDISGHRVIFQKGALYSCSQTDFWQFETLTMFIQLSVHAACHAEHNGI